MLFEMIRIIPRRFLWGLEVNKKPPKANLDFSLLVQPAIRAGWMKSPYPHFSPGRQSHSHTLSLRRTFKRSWIKRIQLRIRNRLPWNSQTRLTQVEDHIAHKELQLQSLEIWKMCISSSSKLKTHKKCFNWTHLCAFWIPLQFHRHLRLFLHNPNLEFQNCWWAVIFDQIITKNYVNRHWAPFSFSSCSLPRAPRHLRLHYICLLLPCGWKQWFLLNLFLCFNIFVCWTDWMFVSGWPLNLCSHLCSRVCHTSYQWWLNVDEEKW